jgi:hypothetical protein
MIFPILNPLVSMLIIATYRKSFIDFLRWLVGKEMIYGGWRKSPAFTSSVAVMTPDNRSIADGQPSVPLRCSQITIVRPSTAASFIQAPRV